MAIGDNEEFSDQSWEFAAKLVRTLGPIPSSVSDVAKRLWPKDSKELSLTDDGRTTLAMIDKSRALKAPLAYAAAALNPAYNPKSEGALKASSIVEALGPKRFCCFLALIYLHKRLAKVCKSEHWPGLSAEFVQAVELASEFGGAVVKADQPLLMLAMGLRYSALGLMLLDSEKGFAEYRHTFSAFDINFECRHWGCDHGQLAAILAEKFHFPVEPVEFAKSLKHSREPCKALPEEYRLLNSAIYWVEGVRQKSRPSLSQSHSKELGLSELQLTDLQQKLSDLRRNGSRFEWLMPPRGNT